MFVKGATVKRLGTTDVRGKEAIHMTFHAANVSLTSGAQLLHMQH